ncbi:hypothetical protein C8Q72DRAFT_882990 [Fomitopsis betulina]|nr:hypothetical protein C8Q72DRAFT_882990 [Fomitopsis betulina]
MTKAKSSAELALEAQELSRTSRLAGIGTGGKQGTRGGPGTITPSPSGSPSELRAQTLNYAPQIPEPPDTPPPLAPAIAHPGYAYPIPPGTASSCSSTPSIPEHQFSSASGQPRPHVQVDFTSTRSSHSHSPEQSYASPTQSHGGGGFQSATDHTAAWVYSGHTAHYQQQQYLPTHQQQVLHPHQRTKSVSPTQRTQPAHAHAASAQYGYDYSENYQLQYPDTSAVQSAEYAQPVSAPSRQSVPHISPSRPPMSMLGSEGTSGYGGAGARYDAPTAALLSRYIGNDAGTPVAGSSVHHGHASQGSMAQSYPPTAPNAPVESRTMYAYSDQSPHRYGEPQAGEDAASAYYAAGYGGPAAERSSPRTLPPIQTARIVRDDSQQQQQQPQPQHAQPSPTSALDASHQQASYAYSTSYHQQQQQQQQQMSAEHVHPQTHAQEPDRAPAPADVPLHQPRPHYSPQQYGAFYAPAAAAAGGGYYRRAGHDHIVAR